jgi:LemA protein
MEKIKTSWIVLGVIAVLLLWVMGAYNGLVAGQNNINGQWAQVENQLQRRNDLIPNLVKVVKGYAKHEKDVFANIADARARLAGAKSIDDKVKANNDMSNAISRLLMIAENYPNLKANQNFLALQDQLEGTENRIAIERQRYNELVKNYNNTRNFFPGNIIGGIFKFEKNKEYIKVPESKKDVPNVDM